MERFFALVLYSFCSLFVFCCQADLVQETIYLTWQQNPSTTMTVQWISPSSDNKSFLTYRPGNDESQWEMAKGETIAFPGASHYLIHRVELLNLKPDAEYRFKIPSYPEEYRFLTAPSHLDKEFRFVVGGDMYHDGIALLANTCKRAALTSPVFALIGGDIAYAVHSRVVSLQKTERWIDWIKIWHAEMVTPKGHLIPVIAAIGNHDLIGEYNQTPAEAAVFSTLFPMPGSQIYNVLDFNSYLTLFILDSGHAHPISGKQTDWLKEVLSKRQSITHRFAIYHVPAYPSVRTFSNEISVAIRDCWVPLFESFGLHAAFEHHDHAYKRTYPLLKNKIHPQGVVYIGDGCWGVQKPRKQKSKRPYIAKFAPIRHFIAVTLTGCQEKFQCITDQGESVDEYVVQATQKK